MIITYILCSIMFNNPGVFPTHKKLLFQTYEIFMEIIFKQSWFVEHSHAGAIIPKAIFKKILCNKKCLFCIIFYYPFEERCQVTFYKFMFNFYVKIISNHMFIAFCFDQAEKTSFHFLKQSVPYKSQKLKFAVAHFSSFVLHKIPLSLLSASSPKNAK